MSPFDIESQLNHIRQCSSEKAGSRPLIALTGNYDEGRLQLLPGYFRSVEAAGGVAVVVPPRLHPDASLIDLLDRVDGVLLTGGADLNPLFDNEDPIPALGGISPERDAFELALARLAHDRQMPLFGICRGIQVLAAALGGKVSQDLAACHPGQSLIKHSQQAPRGVATHWVSAEADSIVGRLLGRRFAVNSFHHQAVAQPGPNFRVTARSADGVVEAIESTDFTPVMGVQWHPECFLLEGDRQMMPLFEHFVEQAAQFRRTRMLHRHTLTLDSHCDTPMFFDKGVDLTRRDPQLLVDFQKMREGMLDATVMVAYLPQGELTDEGHRQAGMQAVRLLDEIAQRVEAAPGVALAQTPAQLAANKRKGLLSVMRGIENGYALGTDLKQVERFARMGLVYITLCHNGDNLICDSARRSQQLHGGLSDYGRQVVAEMNRCGLMVDLSHAAESSFYDALAQSRTPIVCSHASCRALCDHPRNLTDDQLRALAQAGGVAQITLYAGFLRAEGDGTATLDDAVRHLLHAIEVAGVEHVGIGTDFDGDGGVPGLASASQLPNLTSRLLSEGLTEADLARIWGGNFLRVMQQCQQARTAF